MASIVKGTERYFNRYEAAYNRLKGTNQFFEDSDWQYLQDLGNMDNINMYITGSEKLQKEGYTAEQIFGTGPNNSNTRFMSIITEAFLKDDNTVKTHFVPWSPDEVTKLKEEAAAYEEQYKADARDRVRTGEKMYEYDNKALNTLNLGGKEEELTEYEYMKRLIQNEQLTIDNEHWNQFTKETKDINFWTKLGGGALSVLANIGIGADTMLSAMAATFVHGGSYLFFDIWNDAATNTTKNLDYTLRMIDEQSKGTFTNAEIAGRSFQDVMIDFESDYTNFRDEYGNLTTAGQIFVNAARTAGEMMAASFIGGGLARQLGAVSPTYAFAADGTFRMVGYSSKTAKLGKLSFDLARIVGTTTYYAPMAARSMAANYVELSAADPSIHTGTIVAHSITATAAEIAIEIGLGKLLGDTGLNKWLLGGGKPNPKIVKNFAGYLGTYAKDILQEGTEELLQEFSNIAIDNAFGKAVNENFAQLSELTFQTAANAFIIGALVSAGHAGVNVVSDIVGASPLTVADGEGNTTQLSRLQSVVYGYNLKTYSQSVKDASTKMADALDRMYKALPVSEQIVYLTEELSEAEDELKRYEVVSEIGKKTGLSDETVSEITGIEIDEETESAEPKDSSKMGQYRTELREVKKANLEQNVKRIKSELARLKKESSKEQNAIKKGVTQGDKKSRKTAKELRAVKQDFVDAFSAMVASSRMIQAFSSEIGAEQVAKAEELLTAMTKKIKAEDGGNKLNPEYIAKSLEEMTSVLRLKGIHISKKDIEKLKKSGNTTILELYNIDDFGKKKEEPKPTFDENSPGYKKEHEEIEKVFNGSDLKNVAVTEDGESAVELEDGETIVVPQAEVKAGATEIFKDLAEQKLVESLMNYEFKGSPISRVIKIFKDIYGEDKTDEEAVYALCFDKTFYATVLDGDTERGISIADSDMFQFLVALEKMLDSVVPNNVKTEIYKTRIESVRNDMVAALFEYVKLQPHADYRLDVFNSTQKIELIKLYEAGEFANRIVSGKYTPDDWKLLMAKVDAINLSTEKKNQLKEAFKSNRPTVIKAALAAIDEQYKIMFDGSHNGSIYMPSNNLANKTFNQFLYRQGLEISDLLAVTSNDADVLKQYGEPSEKNILKLRSKQLQQFSNGKYGLRIMPKSDRQVDPSDSYFNVGNFTVRIVSLKNNIDSRNRNQFESDVVYALNRSDVAYRSGRNTTLVNDILASDVVKDYYVIDDIITNPSLLSNEIQSKIKEKFGDLNDENVFRFLKQYFLQKTGNISISLTQDGEVVFVDLKDSTKMINGEKAKTIKYGTTKLSEVVNPDYQIPFFNNVTIAKSDKGTYIINEGRAGKDKYVLYLDNQGGTLRDLTTSLAHETQHAIQIANKLNYGNDGEILSRMYKADQKRVIKEVKEHLPNLFEGVDESEHEGIVNDFLYYASGEAEAYGSSFNEVVDFYPVVVKINEDRTSTVTLPWGTVIKTIKSNQRASKKYDTIYEMNDDYMKLATSKKSIEDFTPAELKKLQKLVDETAKINGFDPSIPLYHGTGTFGFTNFITDEAFVADRKEVSDVYVRTHTSEDNENKVSEFIGRSPGQFSKNKFKSDFKETLEFIVNTVNRNMIVSPDSLSPQIKFIASLQTGEVFSTSDLGKEILLLKYYDDRFDPELIHAVVYPISSNLTKITLKAEGMDEWLDNISGAFAKGLMTGEDVLLQGIEKFVDSSIVDPAAMLNSLDYFDSELVFVQNDRPGRYKFYGKSNKRLIVDAKNAEWYKIPYDGKTMTTQAVGVRVKEQGYDSVLIKSVGTYKTKGSFKKGQDEYIYLYPNRDLRSADPITYDSEGKVIPLTERFKVESEDFRYDVQQRLDSQNERMLSLEDRITDLADGADDYVNTNDGTFVINPFTGEVTDIPEELQGKKLYYYVLDDGINLTEEDRSIARNLKDRVKSIVAKCIKNDVMPDWSNPDFFTLFVEEFHDYLRFDVRVDESEILKVYNKIIDVIQQTLYPDTFYSQMMKAVEGMKDGKHGAQSVIPYLKDQKRGVKDEEIEWSGLEAFLEGKKSVTKEELLEFVAGSMLQIEEEILEGDQASWDQYSIVNSLGGRNHRNLLFKLPNSTYENQNMNIHRGSEKSGILAHARISDLYKNGEKILFVDEIQSDWHNEGHKKGYKRNDEESRRITERRDETRRARDELISELASYLEATNRPAPEHQARRYVNFGLSNEERKIEEFRKFCENVGLSEDFKRRIEDYRPEYQKALDDWHRLDDLVPDAPFKDTYQEFVMKRLVRMAAQEGYDRIAWTDKDMQLDRWNPRRETYREMGEPYVSEVKNPDAVAFEEGYRTEYDIQIPSFMKKAYKKFGVKVEKGSLQGDDIQFDFEKRDDGAIRCIAINITTGELTRSIVNSEEARVAFVEDARERLKSEQMWSMPITAEMKKSVLREGQPLYDKAREIDWDVDEKLAAKMPEDATLEDIKTVFNELNENSELKILFEKVYAVCEKLVPEGLTISFNDTHRSFSTPDSRGRYASGHYQGNRINYFKSYIASKNVDPQFRASVLLHELIHAAVSQHLMALESGISVGHFIDPLTGRICKMPKKLYTEIKPDSSWSDGMKGALALAQIFEQIYLDSVMDRDTEIYGTINVHEFVAELANPEFRMYLKKKTLWQRIIDAIKRIFGMAETNALSAADMALNKVLDSYNSYQPYVMPDFLSKYMTPKSNSGSKARMKAASRRVPIKSTKGSNLEAFGGQQLSPELKGFIEDAHYTPDGGINKGLWLKIKDGTLKRTDIFDYFYSTPGTGRRDKETFDLINKHYFKNKHIKSFKELDQRVTLLPQYYAIMKIMREHKFDKDLAKINDPNLFDVFKQLMSDNKVDARRFNQYVLEFEESVEYDTKAVRRLWMRKFDGSVRSIGIVANIALQLQNEEYMSSTTKINTTSIDATKEGKDGDELKLSEIIEDKEVDEALSADDQFYMRLYTQGDEAYDDASEALDVLSAFADNPEALRAHVLTLLKDKADDPSFEAGMKRLALLLETTGKKTDVDTDVEAAIIRASNRMSKRTPRNMVQNIKHHEADINAMIRSKTIKSEGRKQFLRDTKGVFDENFNLIKDTYKSANGRYLEESILLKLEKTLKDLKQAIKDGVYSKQGVDFHKESEAFMDEVRKTLKEMSKGKPVEFKLSNNEVRVNSSKPMPEAIRKIINTELDKSAPTRVQMLTKDNEIHAKIMMSKFIEGNIDFLQNLDQGEVDEIIDYFLTTEMLPSTNEGIIYVSVKQFMLGYLLKANDEGGRPFSLTEKQINDVENHLRTMVSAASTIVVNWREILRSYNLRKEETKASMRFYDLNLSHETQDLVVRAVISGNVTAMRNAKDQAFKELKKKYGNRKTTIWEKMINLQRVMMLSSPGTWVRNIASNLLIGGVKSKEGKVIIPGLNEITELMALLPQTKASKRLAAKDISEHRTGSRRVYTQYKIVGTKVTTDVQSFIKKDLLDNGYLNLITNGLMKYSTGSLRSTGLTGVDKVVGLIKSAVENQLFDNTNFAQFIISKVMSDSWAVNRSMIRFLGKMLTEDNVDVSKGMTENILPYIADAYVMAAQDFMHRPNFFNKLEYWAKNHARHTIGDNWAGAAFFLYKQIIPFGAASWNWFVDKLDYTPLGLGKGIIDLIRLENTVDRMITAQSKGVQVRSQRFAEYLSKRRIGKGVIGTVALIAGILLVAAGKAGVDDEDDKYKIWVGSGPDRIYLDLSNLHGTNSLTVGMAIADSFIDARNGEFNIDKFNKVISDVLDEMLNDFVLTDVYNQFRHYDSLGEAAVDMPIQIVDMFMPKFLGTVSAAFRKHRIKYSSGFKGDLERLAGSFFAPLAESLGAEYWINPYTGKPEAVNKFYWMTIFNKFSPVKVNQYEIGESEKIAIGLGISSSMLTGRYTINDKKVNLDSAALNELNTYYGERNAKELKDFINGKTKYRVETVNGDYKLLSYRTMTDAQKKAVIERIMSNNSRFAKIYILTKDGKYKYYASDSEYEELRKAGIVKNVYRKTKKLEGFVNN